MKLNRYFTHWSSSLSYWLGQDAVLGEDGTTDGGCSTAAILRDGADHSEMCAPCRTSRCLGWGGNLGVPGRLPALAVGGWGSSSGGGIGGAMAFTGVCGAGSGGDSTGAVVVINDAASLSDRFQRCLPLGAGPGWRGMNVASNYLLVGRGGGLQESGLPASSSSSRTKVYNLALRVSMWSVDLQVEASLIFVPTSTRRGGLAQRVALMYSFAGGGGASSVGEDGVPPPTETAFDLEFSHGSKVCRTVLAGYLTFCLSSLVAQPTTTTTTTSTSSSTSTSTSSTSTSSTTSSTVTSTSTTSTTSTSTTSTSTTSTSTSSTSTTSTSTSTSTSSTSTTTTPAPRVEKLETYLSVRVSGKNLFATEPVFKVAELGADTDVDGVRVPDDSDVFGIVLERELELMYPEPMIRSIGEKVDGTTENEEKTKYNEIAELPGEIVGDELLTTVGGGKVANGTSVGPTKTVEREEREVVEVSRNPCLMEQNEKIRVKNETIRVGDVVKNVPKNETIRVGDVVKEAGDEDRCVVLSPQTGVRVTMLTTTSAPPARDTPSGSSPTSTSSSTTTSISEAPSSSSNSTSSGAIVRQLLSTSSASSRKMASDACVAALRTRLLPSPHPLDRALLNRMIAAFRFDEIPALAPALDRLRAEDDLNGYLDGRMSCVQQNPVVAHFLCEARSKDFWPRVDAMSASDEFNRTLVVSVHYSAILSAVASELAGSWGVSSSSEVSSATAGGSGAVAEGILGDVWRLLAGAAANSTTDTSLRLAADDRNFTAEANFTVAEEAELAEMGVLSRGIRELIVGRTEIVNTTGGPGPSRASCCAHDTPLRSVLAGTWLMREAAANARIPELTPNARAFTGAVAPVFRRGSLMDERAKQLWEAVGLASASWDESGSPSEVEPRPSRAGPRQQGGVAVYRYAALLAGTCAGRSWFNFTGRSTLVPTGTRQSNRFPELLCPLVHEAASPEDRSHRPRKCPRIGGEFGDARIRRSFPHQPGAGEHASERGVVCATGSSAGTGSTRGIYNFCSPHN